MNRRGFLKTAAAAGALNSILPGAEPDPALVKATNAVLAATLAEADPERPICHFRLRQLDQRSERHHLYKAGASLLPAQPLRPRISQHWGPRPRAGIW